MPLSISVTKSYTRKSGQITFFVLIRYRTPGGLKQLVFPVALDQSFVSEQVQMPLITKIRLLFLDIGK